MTDSTVNELLELLKESREYMRYFGELGVENVAVPTGKAVESSTVARAALTAEPSAQPKARAALDSSTTSSHPEQLAPSKPAGATVKPTLQSSLFGELAPPEPKLPQSDETLEDIWRDIGDCTRCGLCEGRTQVVNTFGNPKARLMFVGEAPGADEDAQGKPFVGRAGQLLTKIIEAIGMKREELMNGNVNRCRQTGNCQNTLVEAAI